LHDASGDTALVERARRGDSAAFREIVRRHEEVVAGTVVGMLGAGDDADDVGQETFIRFYRSMHRFRGDATLRTYLTRIAMNLSLNALKRRKRRSARVQSFGTGTLAEVHGAAKATAAPGPDVEFERRETRRVVRAAIDALDERHRAVVVLRMMEGLSTREAAGVLRVPEGTVLSRLSRALDKLELDLEGWMEIDDRIESGTDETALG